MKRCRHWIRPCARNLGFQLVQVVAHLASEGFFLIDSRLTKWFAVVRLLTGYLEALLSEDYFQKYIQILTPADVNARGSQLSLKFDTSWPVREIHSRLEGLGVICDVREPDVMRIGPAPLYNSFAEMLRFANLVRQVNSSLSTSPSTWPLNEDAWSR